MQKEKRKVNLVGQNTLTVSLPNDFVKKNNISKGDELLTFISDREVTFSLENKKENSKEKVTSFDASKFSSYTLTRYLTFLYLTNYKKIIIYHSIPYIKCYKSKTNKQTKDLIRSLSDRLLGAEIVSQTSNKTEIECFLSEEAKSLSKIEKQIYFLIKELFTQLIENIDSGEDYFKNEVYEHHDTIDKFINYYLRIIDSSGRSNIEKNMAFSFYANIKMFVDKIRHINERIQEYGITKKVRNYLEEIFNLLDQLFLALYKGKITENLIEKRYELIRKINEEDFTKEELRVMVEAKIITDSLNSFSHYIFSKEN